MNLHYAIHLPHRLTATQHECMFALFSAHYDCVSRNDFMADLARKTSVILLCDEDNIIRGFSTQEIYETQYQGETIRILFSGDTIIEPACWGSQELVRGWCALVAQMLREAGQQKCYWFLISKGYRTYLYLPLFFKSFYPNHAETSMGLQPLLVKLAMEKFPSVFDEKNGIIRFNSSQGQLRRDLCEVPDGRQNNADVIYFIKRNPDYAQGTELACLAEISLNNTHGVGRRLLQKAIADIA